MPDRQRLIGVCLAQAHMYLNVGYLAALDQEARQAGYRVVVFNSTLDFYWYPQGNHVARSIYTAIEPGAFAALVFVRDSFQDQELIAELVLKAKASGVPVLSIGAVFTGCISIVNDYCDAYKSLLRHVIVDHGARDTFFLAGLRKEAHSGLRLQCWREVLAEQGIPVLEENIAYGDYWERPAKQVVLRLIREREQLPRAIFCANDSMALAVCEILQEQGYRVPQDVIVTGFDGIPAASLARPRLATCSHDPEGLAQQTIDILERLRQGLPVDNVYQHLFKPIFSESGGCAPTRTPELVPLAIYRQAEAMTTHENQLYHNVERMLMRENMQDFLDLLAHAILPDSAVYLNKSFLTAEQGAEYSLAYLEDELVRIPFRNHDEEGLLAQTVSRSELPLRAQGRPGMTLLTAIHSDTTVCGCFAAYTEHLEEDSQKIKRLCDVLNLVFTILLGNARQRKLLTHLENSQYLDPLTGLSNIRGLRRWFEGYTAAEENHHLLLAFSVYGIHRYAYLQETYGISEIEAIVSFVGKSLSEANQDALHLARISEDHFVVVNHAEGERGISEIINRCVRAFFSRMERFNTSAEKPYFLEVNCGCTTMDVGWHDVTLENLIHLAKGEMYLNRLRDGTHEVTKNTVGSDAGIYSAFQSLLERNLFQFYFQPIVDAHTGTIFAYEALMRTMDPIRMNPLQVLDIAREYHRLYDVERATLFGIMERFTQDFSAFHNNKIFLNTIPGSFLNQEDCRALMERYEPWMDCFIFELTEQNETSDEELGRLKELHKIGGQTQIAIDDFGTGHSNIVNLLRYAPQIIKIDRGLISGIQDDGNKQLFVRNTIDFAHQNGIKALAEGVETVEELRMVIDFGVDLIQGFYTARPAAEPLAELPEHIRVEIVAENQRIARAEEETLVYAPESGEIIHLIDLSLQSYTAIDLPEGEVTLLGEHAHTVDMAVHVPDGTHTRLILDNANFRGKAEPSISLGAGSALTLEIRGDCSLRREGILVPATASLLLTGEGNLRISASRNYAIGIGTGGADAFGTIEVDMGGGLFIHSSGEKMTCLGGGRSAGDGILLRRGNIHLEANGVNVIGLGSVSGPVAVRAEGATLQVHVQGNDALGIGTLRGDATLHLRGQVESVADGERAVAIGTMNGSARLWFAEDQLLATARCDIGTCVGSFSGDAELHIDHASLLLHGEGNRVAGLGSINGTCQGTIQNSQVTLDLLAGEALPLGNDRTRLSAPEGTFRSADGTLLQTASGKAQPV